MRPIATGVGSNLRRDFRPQCSRDLTVRLAPSDASETSAFLRAAHSQKWMKWSNLNMLKNPQKHWDFAKCAGLRMVISLSAMRARAWKTTKIPSATLRTRLVHKQSDVHGSSPVRCPIRSRTIEFSLMFSGMYPSAAADPLRSCTAIAIRLCR